MKILLHQKVYKDTKKFGDTVELTAHCFLAVGMSTNVYRKSKMNRHRAASPGS
jgi:hypothetical protein